MSAGRLGGPWAYAELLESIKDPARESHTELTEWIGDDFDPDADQAEWLIAEVDALAKNGRASRLQSASNRADPRPSPKGYGEAISVRAPQSARKHDFRALKRSICRTRAALHACSSCL
jgi:hypothetical protein